MRGLALLLGPALIFVLACNGYETIKTFYRRFAEVWVTTINLESILHIRYTQSIQLGNKPVFLSKEHSFIPTIEWQPIKQVLDEAKENGENAETVAEKLEKKGTTLRNAKFTFIAFGVAAAILSVFIVLTTVLPNFVQK